MTTSLNILAISGSLRARSSNTEALRAAAILAPPSASIRIFDGLDALPYFNPDLLRSRRTGSPPKDSVHRLLRC